MTELDTLNSKSVADLTEIAVAIGVATAEDAGKRSKEELISLITGQPIEEKPKRAKKAKAETSSEAPAEEKTEDKPKEESKPKRKSKSAKKTAAEDTKSDAKAEEPKTEEQAPAEEAPKAKKTPSKRGKKSKKTADDAQIALDIPADETKAETAPAETSTEEAKGGEAAPAAPVSKKQGKSRKRRLSFGPDKDVQEVAIPEEEKNANAESSGEEAEAEPAVPEIVYREVEGILSIGNGDKGDFSGFIHCNNYLPGEDDAYVPGQLIRRMGLRRGDKVKGLVTAPRGKDRYAPLKKVLEVNGIDVSETEDYDVLRKRPRFETLTAIYPNERLTLETNQEDLSTRIIDLF